MTRVIGVLAGKGGVGKTTITANLSFALTELGQEVIAIDANPTTSNLGLHFGMPLASNTLHDLLKGNSEMKDVIYSHPFGFKFIPSSMNVNDLIDVDIGRLPEVTLNLLGKTDFVLLDCAPSLGREAISAISAVNEILIVTNPDMPSVMDALKTMRIVRDAEKKIIGVVVNKIKGDWYELTKYQIEDILNVPVLAWIPEDENVPKSISLKMPVVDFFPHSPASIEIKRLAHTLAGVSFRYEIPRKLTLLERLANWIVG